MVKELIKADQKVIIMPLYKSFTDYFVHMYVARTQGIESGFAFGNFEDTPDNKVFGTLLRSCGYIFSRRKFGQSLQSNYINGAVMKALIAKDKVTTIYQNSKRFRAGKLHKKFLADMTVRWLLEAFIDMHEVG